MKIYKSRFLSKVEKAARKGRALRNGTLYSHYIISEGICYFMQGYYAIRGAVPTANTDENEKSFLCKFDLKVNPRNDFFIDSKGNATQTTGNDTIMQEGAFKPLGDYNLSEDIEKIFNLKSVDSMITIDRKLLIELLDLMKDNYVTLSIVNQILDNRKHSIIPCLKLDGLNNNAVMLPIVKQK